FVDPTTKRRVNHQLHSAAFVEETLGDDRCLGRNCAEHGAARDDVFDRLLSAGWIESAFLLEPANRVSGCGSITNRRAIDYICRHVGDFLTKVGYLLREF